MLADGTKYYMVNVSVQTETNRGNVKNSTEQYLTNAASVTEAEANIVKDWKASGDIRDYAVKSVTETRILKVV